jgi:hypothetical protein
LLILGFISVEDAYDAASLRVNVLKSGWRILVEFGNEFFELRQLIVELDISFGIVNVGILNYFDDLHLLLVNQINLLNNFPNLQALVFELLLLTPHDFVQTFDFLHEHLEIALWFFDSAQIQVHFVVDLSQTNHLLFLLFAQQANLFVLLADLPHYSFFFT